MKFDEAVAKGLIEELGIAVPGGRLAASPEEAGEAQRALGPAMVKAQVPAGRRGKAGAIRLARSPEAAVREARALFGRELEGWRVERLLVEEAVEIAREFYAAVMIDPDAGAPLVLVAPEGGMEVEALAAGSLRRIPVALAEGLTAERALAGLEGLDLAGSQEALAGVLAALYRAWRALDAELLEVNPLALTPDGRLLALDCKLEVDDSAAVRQPRLAGLARPAPRTALEAEAAAAGLTLIQLGGSVGVLANGAGLTMTTIDAIRQFGGQAANFLEIGGEAYTRSETALEILLKQPGIASLVVNFCGAFARTDVMTAGVVEAWKRLRPEIPVFFSILGTGEEEARALLERELGLVPLADMDLAVRAAVEAAA